MRVAACLFVICCTVLDCRVGPAQSLEAKPPNIVFILVDDLGWSDPHCYGNTVHRTPNIDRLASEGLRFTSGYSSAPICSAARASILTGKTTARLGFEFVTKNRSGLQQLDAEVPLQTPVISLNLPLSEWTIAEHLAAIGYQTAFFGKWHVSQHHEGRYLAWHPEFGPRKQGFEFAIEEFGDHPYAWSKKKSPPKLPKGVFPADSMVDATAEYIRGKRDSEKPFFVMASSFYVHTPVKNRCRWLVDHYAATFSADALNRKNRLEYAAFVETLDHHVGTILDAIDDSGQRRNTLVFFMSDNGGHPEYSANAPLRGSKWNLYEGGIRVPMIARWPKVIPASIASDVPVIGYDVLPTFVELAGGTTSDVDGASFADVFTNPQWRSERPLLWHFPYYHPETTFSKAIDEIGIDDFATSKTRPQSAIRLGRFKLIHFAEDDRVELYDLDRDLSEQRDLSAEQTKVASMMRTLLRERLKSANAREAKRRR